MTETIHRQEGLSLVTSMILILFVAGLLFAAYIWAMLHWELLQRGASRLGAEAVR